MRRLCGWNRVSEGEKEEGEGRGRETGASGPREVGPRSGGQGLIQRATGASGGPLLGRQTEWRAEARGCDPHWRPCKQKKKNHFKSEVYFGRIPWHQVTRTHAFSAQGPRFNPWSWK